MMPPEASTIAADVDGLYYFLFYMSIFFMVLIYGATAWFAGMIVAAANATSRPPVRTRITASK